MLDGGLSSPYCPDYIFITHSHSDHTANLPFHIYGKKENSQIQIFSPKEIFDNIKDYIESAYVLSSDVNFKALNISRDQLYLHKFYKNNSVVPGDIINLTIKNKNISVEVIKCFHSVPCVGYGFIEKRMKLKEEYKNLSGKEIGELRKKGENIYYEQQYPFLLYLGDTSKDILKDENLKKYKTIMLECTFLLDDDLDQADKTFHIHWKYIEDYIKENQNITFILYHFSQRYKKKEITEFFANLNYQNIVAWIN
jgi:ribonuclease Z